ncbi:hypothetical protein XENOCAPTIV_021042, partial [Xenoophorus captivus]
SVEPRVEQGAQLGVAARCLSCIADVLVCMAQGKGGLRSGPAANEAWSSAYFLLEGGNLRGGVYALAAQRQHWLSRPDLLVRAARHYEGAGQVLLRQAVMSSQRFISIGQGKAPPIGEWQEVECPARLDLAGGWSDTPPIAFEHGGSVTNVAVKVDGKRPIGARARRIMKSHLLLVSYSGGLGSGASTEIVCESLDDLKDYCQPHAPGALLKAVCVCSGLVSLSSQDPLGHQLMQRWGSGVELHSWSELPTGSGLGTSSILAGALLAAIYRCTGRTYDTDSLIHAVLYLEQILTTGHGLLCSGPLHPHPLHLHHFLLLHQVEAGRTRWEVCVSGAAPPAGLHWKDASGSKLAAGQYLCRMWYAAGTAVCRRWSRTPSSWCPTLRNVPEPVQTVSYHRRESGNKQSEYDGVILCNSLVHSTGFSCK